MANAYDFADYKKIIDTIYSEHMVFTGEWIANVGKTNYNLKKTQIRHICSSAPDNIDNFIDEEFLDYVDDYNSTLGSLYLNIVKRLESEYGLTIGGRIKNDDSILLKLHRKRFEDDGKFSLNKYLNDLLGFRIVDTNYEENIIQLPQYITELKEQKCRFMHKYREAGDYYKEYHVYFMGASSKYFPVELQI